LRRHSQELRLHVVAPRRRLRAVRVLAAAAAAAVVGCQSDPQVESLLTTPGSGLEAHLVASGGAALTGNATLKSYDGGVVMLVSFAGAGPGEYRIAIHATGNCTSANAFSAGPPWAPPGLQGPPFVHTFTKNDDAATLTFRFPGYRLEGSDGVAGRAVVVHAGAQGSLDARPGVPNNRIACGVIGATRRIL